MSKLDEINKLLDELSVSADNARAEKAAAEERARRAEEEAQKAENAKTAFEDVRKKGQEFEHSYNEAMKNTGYTNTENNAKNKKNKKGKKEKKGNGVKGFIAGVLATVITVTGVHFIAESIKNAKDKNDDKNVSNVQEYTVDEKTDNALAAKFREFLENKGIITVNEMATGRVVVTPLKSELTSSEIEELSKEFFTDKLFIDLLGSLDIDAEELNEESKVAFCRDYITQLNIVVDEIDVTNAIENIKTVDEELNTENFEELVAHLAKPYVENNLSVSTEDLTKFTGIMLIDRLAEENPELVQQLFSVQSEEEFLNDAGKVIGNTYMYDHSIWESEKSTENFIWISEGIPENDPQKEKMQLIEDYVRRIAVSAANNEAEEVNKIVAELIEALTSPTGSLNALDDGTEFAAQIYWALINNSIGRNYLNQEYRDYFNVRSTSETNVSNILTVISGCITESKTKSLTK